MTSRRGRAALGRARPRPLARPGGPVLHDAARRPRRARHQGRAPARTATSRAAGGRRTTPPAGMSAYFLSVNRNKESIALDLALAGGSRVRPPPGRGGPTSLVENFPPGGLEKFGLSLAALRRDEPAARDGLDHRLRARRSRRGRAGIRPARAGGRGAHGDHGRAPDGSRRRSASPSRTSSPAATRRSASWPRSRRASGPAAAAHVETDLFSVDARVARSTSRRSALLTGEEAGRHGNAPPADRAVPAPSTASDGEFVLARGHRPAVRAAARRSSAGPSGRPSRVRRPTPAASPNRAGLESELVADLPRRHAGDLARAVPRGRAFPPGRCAGRSRRCAPRRRGRSTPLRAAQRRRVRRVAGAGRRGRPAPRVSAGAGRATATGSARSSTLP